MELILEVHGLERVYRRQGEKVSALRGVSLEVPRGGITALVGRSGSGKSTLARCLALLERPDGGKILLEGRDVTHLKGPALAASRRRIQLVPQDPARSVEARFTVQQALEEPLVIAGSPRLERLELARGLLGLVGLESALLARPARRLSGGQMQRLVLARALACDPRVLILDETLSGLDLSLRARIVNLLIDLLEGRDLTCLLLSHDAALVSHLADRVIVLESGLVADRWE